MDVVVVVVGVALLVAFVAAMGGMAETDAGARRRMRKHGWRETHVHDASNDTEDDRGADRKEATFEIVVVILATVVLPIALVTLGATFCW